MSFLRSYETGSSSSSGVVSNGQHSRKRKSQSDSGCNVEKRGALHSQPTGSDMSGETMFRNHIFSVVSSDSSSRGIHAYHNINPKQFVGGSGGTVEVRKTSPTNLESVVNVSGSGDTVQLVRSSPVFSSSLANIGTDSSGLSLQMAFQSRPPSQRGDSLRSPPDIFPTYPYNHHFNVNSSSYHGMGNFPTSSSHCGSDYVLSPEQLRSSNFPRSTTMMSSSPVFPLHSSNKLHYVGSPVGFLSPQWRPPSVSYFLGSPGSERQAFSSKSSSFGDRRFSSEADYSSFKENIQAHSTPLNISCSYKSGTEGNSSSGHHSPRRLFSNLSSNFSEVSNEQMVIHSPAHRIPHFISSSPQSSLYSMNRIPQYVGSSPEMSLDHVNRTSHSISYATPLAFDNVNRFPYSVSSTPPLSVDGVSSLEASFSTRSSLVSVGLPDRLTLLAQPFYVYNEGPPIRLNLVPEFSVGRLSGSCRYCKALYFPGEVTSAKAYTKCCGKGKVHVDRRNDFPDYLKDLFTGNSSDSGHFRENIRKFNSAFAFASFGHQSEKVPGRGPYCFKIGGNVYHSLATSVNPVRDVLDGKEAMRTYCQVYVLDSQEATRTRLEHPANQNLLLDVMEKVHRVLKEVHPFAVILHDMKSLMEREKSLAEKQNRPCDDFTLRILDRNTGGRSFSGAYHVITANEVAIIYKSIDDDQHPGLMNRAIHSRASNKLQSLPANSSLLDTLSYPLFFPKGESNWTPDDTDGCPESNSTSMQKWYRYALQIRSDSDGFSPILMGGKLTDQYVCDVRLRIEGRNIDWYRHNQATIRVESYLGLHDHLRNSANLQKKTVGRVYVLPSTYTGGPRYMQALYNDAMAMVTELGFPDFFVTMTCNPNWKEIKDNLGHCNSPNERKDLIVRVFKLKLAELMLDFTERNIFGLVKGWTYSIEFQKRGLPHAHIIIILDKSCKPTSSRDVDKYVCAELPNEQVHPELFSCVREFMLHGPCGVGSVCAKNENGKWICKKKFPKAFQPQTDFNVDSYPLYQRRDNKGHCPVWKNKTVDNSYVVPYNPYLLMKYNCHINVEIVSSIKAIKYIYKYCFKGVDRLCFQVVGENTLNYDELTAYTNGRYLCPAEAFWRLYEFPTNEKSHTVVRLPVHEELRQSVVFSEGKEREAFEKAEGKGTMLIDYFRLNREDCRARKLLYSEIPQKYCYKEPAGRWEMRKQKNYKLVVRLHGCSPRDIERHSVRQLLLHRRGCISFEDLRTVDGVKYSSFKEAAVALGLINNALYWKTLFDEAVLINFPKGLRDLLVSLCSAEDTSNIVNIWDHYKTHLVDDFVHRGCSLEEAFDRGLNEISRGLEAIGTTLEKVGLPQPFQCYIDPEVPTPSDLEEIRKLCSSLNKDQMIAVQSILRSVGRVCGKSFLQFSSNFFPQSGSGVVPPKLFFLDGAGGTGKTFVYTVLCKIFEYSGISHITVAPTGIAASILPNGRTAHSKFGIPLDLTKGQGSNISFDDPKADEIRRAKVVIWDEIGMTRRKMLEITHKLFLDVRFDSNGRRLTELFGGCVVVAGGDFRQQGPVVLRASRPTFLSSCVKSSILWQNFKKLSLRVNMRAGATAEEFSSFLLKVGDNSFVKPACVQSDYILF